MAANANTNPTLLDLATREGPDGKIMKVAEILNQTNEVLDEMSWQEGNMTDGHKSTVRTGLPAPTWRKMYQGVQPTKSTTAQIKDQTGMMEAFSEVDKALADLAGNRNEFLLTESMAFLEGMNQEMAQTLFYGNEGVEPEAFTGLSPRYNSLAAANSDNIIDAGGTGSDNASIWLVVWGPMSVYGVVPKGSTAGLQQEFLGDTVIENSPGSTDGGRWRAYRTHFRWDAGLVLRDWRFAVRIANIDKSDLTRTYNNGNFATGANLPDLMFQAMRLIPNLAIGRPSFYCSRDIATWIARQTAAGVQASTLTSDAVSGDRRFTERFHGIPIRRVDALAADEARVT